MTEEISGLVTQIDAETAKVSLRWKDSRRALTFAEAMREFADSPGSGARFSAVLATAPFEQFFWECPPVNALTIATTPFECRIVLAHPFPRADSFDFRQHLDAAEAEEVAVAFPNLGGDSTLVAPTDLGANYAHLAAFCRDHNVPGHQHDRLWRLVAQTFTTLLQRTGAQQPIWLSTEGSGVPWLHVRLDSRPKYYKTTAFRLWPPPSLADDERDSAAPEIIGKQ